jgi:hypothetical protein
MILPVRKITVHRWTPLSKDGQLSMFVSSNTWIKREVRGLLFGPDFLIKSISL